MDKNTVIGFSLIFVLMLGWFYFTLPSEEEIAEQRRQQAAQDSLNALEQVEELPEETTEPAEIRQPAFTTPDEEQAPQTVGIFSSGQDSTQTEFVVETPRYTAVFTNLGAGPSKFTLKDHNTWSGQPIQMIGDTTRSAYNTGFLTTEITMWTQTLYYLLN